MFSVRFDVLDWAAWAPGLQSPEDWHAWLSTRKIQSADAVPDVTFIPAIQRRRLSRLSKMALWTLDACAKGEHQHRTVFSSPHGEIHRTVELLQELAKQEPLSPMGFSLSVHNTAAGIYSITAGNRAPSTSVASGCDTLEQAMIEAVTQSAQCGNVVLLSHADEPLPEMYHSGIAVPFSFSLAMKVKANPAGLWQLQTCNHETVMAGLPYGLAPLPLLLGLATRQYARGERHGWHWSRFIADTKG